MEPNVGLPSPMVDPSPRPFSPCVPDIVGSESRVTPPSKDEPKHDTLIRSLTRPDNVSSLHLPPPSLDRKQPRKKKVLDPPTFQYKKLSNVFSQSRTNYPRVPDESPVDVKRKPGV